MSQIFPRDLVPILRAQQRSRALTLDDNMLREVLEVTFNASLLTEEGRPSAFGVIVEPPAALVEQQLEYRVRTCLFDNPRPFTVRELNKLSPTSHHSRTFLIVWQDADQHLMIYGLLDFGSSLHRRTRGFEWHNQYNILPDCLTISTRSPGEMELAIGIHAFLLLQHGSIADPKVSFWDTPIPVFFKPAIDDHVAHVSTSLPDDADDQYRRDCNQASNAHMLWLFRTLYSMRERRHGGTLLFVREHMQSANDQRLTDRLTVKYPCNYDQSAAAVRDYFVRERQWFPVYLRTAPMSWEEYKLRDAWELSQQTLFETAEFVADLTAVDGAVVLTDHLRVLGFGAEVVAVSPSLSAVAVGSPPYDSMPLERFGTRHRSAFRFCSSLEDSVAFVASQDGGVRAIKRDGPTLRLWSNVDAF